MCQTGYIINRRVYPEKNRKGELYLWKEKERLAGVSLIRLLPGLPDKPVLRDDIGQYSMDASYALKLRKLRYNYKKSVKGSGL